MSYWLTGTGLEHVSAALVADDQRGSDERRTPRRTPQRTGQARRVLAAALVALAALLDPAMARPTVVGQPLTTASA